ncbi:SDR family NAD(P)-dependent oxidoreductase [Gordonia terrae]|uniref:KR domain-containing protein n=2 Tax=Gordonia terrae TaxID=2055 RepID=A0AAD0KAG9_9ACTN|nr:SDR family oxidoreductase [Gordonia terrae]VTR08076.1 dehydrogenase [Clostridioides difficile]ANY25207.1 hypothetical protein BCM27_22445 [Gordonia terrae]AWO85955.1 KR domain-containing protein [Gordonia terrae]VTS62184.1 Gluconate 5-dehydrogenase [Gordonia terrae]GAB45547.1 putative oxidoreductase [Gordonia terrae NBRC 100016]
MQPLSGKTVLITGASSGLGEHFARTAVAAGASVVIVAARRIDRLDELATELGAGDCRVVTVPLDVTNRESVATAIATMRAQIEHIDVLVNNAGGGDLHPALTLAESEWNSVLDTNVGGTWRMSQAIAQWSVDRDAPLSIINLSSVLGHRVMPQTTAYATSKAAVLQLTRQLALEWARYGIRVNALCPGYFPTEAAQFADDRVLEAMSRKVPFRRLGHLSELDGPFLLLASDAGRYMSGSTVTVDGALSVNSV